MARRDGSARPGKSHHLTRSLPFPPVALPSSVPISAVFPACKRVREAFLTISVIESCDPRPDELIVHVDGGNDELARAISAKHPEVRIITSSTHVGPGGARNRLIREARNELVANFDDDSYPEHRDYFARVMEDFRLFPDMAVLSAASMQIEKDMPGFMRIGIFSGCGCVFSKSWFLKTTGMVPLRVAYCMEETDLSLRLHELGGVIVHDPGLQVLHYHELADKPEPDTNAGTIANTALMPFLRYPLALLPLGLWHVASRICSVVRRGWWGGLGRGLLLIPRYFVKYAAQRDPLPARSILSWYDLRRHPKLIKTANLAASTAGHR